MTEPSGVFLTEPLFLTQNQTEFDSFLQMLKENETIEFPFMEVPKDLNPQTSTKLEAQQQIPPDFFMPQQQMFFGPDQFSKAEPLSSSPSSSSASEEKDYMSYVTSNIMPNFADQKAIDPYDELLEKMAFHKDEAVKQKRKREVHASKESQQEKHKSAERKRRSDINEYIDGMKTMLPSYRKHGEKAGKMTKLQVLTEAHEYMGALQDFALFLVQENKTLRERLGKYEDVSTPDSPQSLSAAEGASSPSSDHAPKRSRSTTTAAPSRTILFVFLSVVMITFFVPTNFGFNSSEGGAPMNRNLLGLTFSNIPTLTRTSIIAVFMILAFLPLPALPFWAWITVAWLFVTFSVYITLFLAFESVVDITNPNFKDAKEQSNNFLPNSHKKNS